MVKKHLPAVVFFTVVLIVGYVYFQVQYRKISENRLRLQQEYIELTPSDSLAGRVQKVYQGNLNLYRNDPYQVYITFSDGTKWSVAGDIAGPGHSPTVDDVIQVGDSLLKRTYDSFFVVIKGVNQVDTSSYYFELR
jgi:hypothetical protein